MPIYEFSHDLVPNQPVATPHGVFQSPAMRQLGHTDGTRQLLTNDNTLSYSDHLEEFLIPGFRALDEGMRNFWSGLRVPTKDSYRYMRVKIAGGDKTVLVWNKELKEGKVRLPVASLNREGFKFNKDRYSPAYHAMAVRYLNSAGSVVAKIYRPVPFLVDYTMIIWTEHKRDLEYILYQIGVRQPFSEFRIFDGKLAGKVQITFTSANDTSDKEVGFDQHPEMRYEVTMEVEAWLPLPERIIKTVLGRPRVIKDEVGNVLLASVNSSLRDQNWFEPQIT